MLLKREKLGVQIRKKLVELTKLYEKILNEKKLESRKQADQLLEQFMKSTFYPKIQKYCAEIKSKSCFPLKRKWNNASLAAYLTYEKESDRIEAKVEKENWTLKQFFSYIERYTREFKGDSQDLEKYLFKL